MARRPRILLAEDDTELRVLLDQALRRAGYEVVSCRNGFELLGELGVSSAQDVGRFDLIISDIRMPGVTGLSLLEGLRGFSQLQPLRMILITAFGDEQTHARARQLGAAAVLDKPFEIEDLIACAHALTGAQEPAPARSRAPVQIVLAEDDGEMRALVAETLRRRGHEVVECEDGIALVHTLELLALNGRRVDLVISDVRMPGLGGLAALEQSRRGSGPVPLIVMTAFPEIETRIAASRLGAAGFLAKPFDLDDLCSLTERLTRRGSCGPEAR